MAKRKQYNKNTSISKRIRYDEEIEEEKSEENVEREKEEERVDRFDMFNALFMVLFLTCCYHQYHNIYRQ